MLKAYYKKILGYYSSFYQSISEYMLLIISLIFFLLLLGLNTCDYNFDESEVQNDESSLTVESEAAQEDADSLGGIMDATGKLVNAFGEAIGGFFNFELPSGESINIPEGGIEQRLLTMLEDIENVDQYDRYYVFDRIYFESGSAKINDQSLNQIKSVVSILKAYPHNVLLRGHTDSTGDLSQNIKLSLSRADALKDLLISLGIDASRIEVTGLGPNEAIGDNETEKGRTLNRRIDISIDPAQ